MDLRAMARAHRRALMRRLDGLIVLHAAQPAHRNGDQAFPYRQASSFLWLTGVEEPGYALVLDPRRGEEWLFCPKTSQKHAVWLGHIPSLAEARRSFGVAKTAYREDLEKTLTRLSRGRGAIYADRRSLALARRAAPRARPDPRALEDALEELRIVKDEAEIALLGKASEATARGHVAAMRAARPGLREYEVQAELEREFLRAGCRDVGYGSIVASGRNSAVLHYASNAARLEKGDLLLIDAGAEYLGYTADVTRTFPVSGRFTARQRDLYEVVLNAQLRVIDQAHAGRSSMDLQRCSEESLAEGLRSLGLLKGGVDELVDSGAIRVFYPHGIGHTLGLDVHDVHGGRRRRLPRRRAVRLKFRARLERGFVITVEPGIYFNPALLFDRELRRKHRARIDFRKAEGYLDLGGIRIEDDVVVQPSGPPKNLTRVPKSVRDVESACAGGLAS